MACKHDHCKSTIKSSIKKGLAVGFITMLIHSLMCPVHGIPALMAIGAWGAVMNFYDEIISFLGIFFSHDVAHIVADSSLIIFPIIVAILFALVMSKVVRKFKFCGDQND